MSHKIKTLILGSLLMAVAYSPVHACDGKGNQMTGRIDTLQTGPIYNGHVVFRFVAGASGQSNSTNNWDYRFDATTAAGKMAYASLLAAHSTGRDVVAYGCDNLISNSEELRWVGMK